MQIYNKTFFLAHILMLALVAVVNIPGQKSVADNKALLVGICVIELIYLYNWIKGLLDDLRHDVDLRGDDGGHQGHGILYHQL